MYPLTLDGLDDAMRELEPEGMRIDRRGAGCACSDDHAAAQPPSPETRTAWGFDRSDLTPDPRIRFGVLANGMRYAILPNRTPARAVSIRLLIRVGATNGAPGEAHYLEHNGRRSASHGADSRKKT